MQTALLNLSKSSEEPAIRLRNIGNEEDTIDARSSGDSSNRKRAIKSHVCGHSKIRCLARLFVVDSQLQILGLLGVIQKPRKNALAGFGTSLALQVPIIDY